MPSTPLSLHVHPSNTNNFALEFWNKKEIKFVCQIRYSKGKKYLLSLFTNYVFVDMIAFNSSSYEAYCEPNFHDCRFLRNKIFIQVFSKLTFEMHFTTTVMWNKQHWQIHFIYAKTCDYMQKTLCDYRYTRNA